MRNFFIFLFSLSSSLYAQTPLQSMALALDKLKLHPDFTHANISFTLLDITSGKVLLEKNKNMPLAPASTLKTFVTAVALKRLGENFRYETCITFKGRIINKNGIGELIVHGSGDPSLGSDRYKETKPEFIKKQIADGLHKLGIETLQGNVKINSQIFEDEAINSGWLAEDVGNYYGAGVYGLNWRENKFEINLAPTKTSFAITSNNANYENQKDFCIELVHKDEATTEEAFAFIEKIKPCMYVIKGVLSPKEKTHNMQLARLHPDEDFKKEIVTMLKQEFQFENKQGIFVGQEQKVATILSPPLSQLVYWCNQKSLNLYAEAFCKTMATKVGKSGSWQTGIRLMIEDALRQRINMKNVFLKDACGLAPKNRITTYILAELLRKRTKDSYFETYYESLPSMNGIIMKSGYIGGTRSYAGYITLKDGRKTSFAFIINNYDCKPKEVKAKMYLMLDMLKSEILPRE
jgi:serine-type D-Ala-D-Ala carboxypeptidase/endopeptidase (penicillin-binding protein 4)